MSFSDFFSGTIVPGLTDLYNNYHNFMSDFGSNLVDVLNFGNVDSSDVGRMSRTGGFKFDQLPPVNNFAPSSPSSSDGVDNYTDLSNNSYFDQYLNMLKKGSEIGLFSTAQDVVDESQRDRLFQSLEAQKERDWYQALSGSAYQRQVADLEAAGLNPILGWSNFGSGAQTAHTSVPTGTNSGLRATAPSLADYLNAGANIVSSASDIISSIAKFKSLFK